MRRIFAVPGLVLILVTATQGEPRRPEKGSVDESFDNTTVRRRTVAPQYHASAEASASSACLMDVYIFMGASVAAANVDMLLLNAHRKGRLQVDPGQLQEIMERHCRPAAPPAGERRNR